MLIINLRDFLIDVYKIDYKYYEFGHCHKHDHSNIDNTFNFKIAKIFPGVGREVIEEVIRDFKIKHFERQYDTAFCEELKLKLTSKVKTDIKNLCEHLNEPYLVPILSFNTNSIIIPSGNSIKKAILAVYNKKFQKDYVWGMFEKEKLEYIKALQPPEIKEHLKYTKRDIISANLYLLNEFEKYFNTGYDLFQFDVSQIKVTAFYEYKEEDIIHHIRKYYPEAHKNSNPALFLTLKKREVQRAQEKEQKQFKKQLAKERRKQLKELSRRGGQ